MITKQDKDLAKWVLQAVLKAGAQQCRVNIYSNLVNSFEFRNTELDNLKQSAGNILEIEIFANQRYASFSTSRMEKQSLEKFIKDAMDSTLALDADKDRQLPAPSRYATMSNKDLGQFDVKADHLSNSEKIESARKVAQEVINKDPRTTSVSGNYQDSKTQFYLLASNGFEGEQFKTNFSLSASVTIKGDGDARPSGSWYESRPFWSDLKKDEIGATALQRAQERIGQKKMQSGTYSMLIDNRLLSRLLSPLIAAMYGSGLQQKNSFLLDKLGQQVISSKISIDDTPHLFGCSGSRWFDDEGVATQNRKLFEQGKLANYFIDTYYSALLKMPPTISSPSVLTFALGTKSHQELIKGLDKAVVVTGFNGGNTNTSTGDFSFGVEGFWVENGELKQAINEMNITGNILELWSQVLEVGNNPNKDSSWQTPSVLFDKVSFSGL